MLTAVWDREDMKAVGRRLHERGMNSRGQRQVKVTGNE